MASEHVWFYVRENFLGVHVTCLGIWHWKWYQLQGLPVLQDLAMADTPCKTLVKASRGLLKSMSPAWSSHGAALPKPPFKILLILLQGAPEVFFRALLPSKTAINAMYRPHKDR